MLAQYSLLDIKEIRSPSMKEIEFVLTSGESVLLGAVDKSVSDTRASF